MAIKGLNRSVAFKGGDGVKVSETVTLVGEDGEYTLTAPGAPADSSPMSLAKHIETVKVSVKQKFDPIGDIKSRSTSAKNDDGGKYSAFIRHAAIAASEQYEMEDETDDETSDETSDETETVGAGS